MARLHVLRVAHSAPPRLHGRRYDKVALDITPQPDEVSVGSICIYPYGKYKGGETNSGGVRFVQGRITHAYKEDGVTK